MDNDLSYGTLMMLCKGHGTSEIYRRIEYALAEKDREIERLKAERCLQHNGARMLARCVVDQLQDPVSHDDAEILNAANGFLKSDVPRTTPWLIDAMNKSVLYQQLMEKAVRFATVLGKSDRVQRWEDLEECWVAALDFLNSQEAQAFLKEREGRNGE